MWPLRKTNARRSRVRKNITDRRQWHTIWLTSGDFFNSALIWLGFVVICSFVLAFQLAGQTNYIGLISRSVIVILVSLGGGLYICQYQKRIITNHIRAFALAGLLVLLLAATKLGVLLTQQTSWATASAVAAAVILTIAYDQRFAIGMSFFYCLLACFAAGPRGDIKLFLITISAAFTCCLSLREIRTRMKLLEAGSLTALVVFIVSIAFDLFTASQRQFLVFSAIGRDIELGRVFSQAGWHAGAALLVALVIQSLLPLIEKTFRIATSMTLLDYSDANQPLLKKLAMEAPGTFSHSLLIGSVAEAAAEAIGRNGLLSRVGAYYHDIGKINKAGYFIENEMGLASRHKELSPAMSQLIIAGHVKDGIEMAKEYGLPAVLRQFIETHHGTTLIEYFYNKAIEKHSTGVKSKKADRDLNSGEQAGEQVPEKDQKTETAEREQLPPSETEFRYAGPKPRSKEAAIVMLADTVEGAVRASGEVTPTKIEGIVHNMAMKRLQDGQFDMCDLSLRELSEIESSISKTLAAHYHGRIKYTKTYEEETPGEP